MLCCTSDKREITEGELMLTVWDPPLYQMTKLIETCIIINVFVVIVQFGYTSLHSCSFSAYFIHSCTILHILAHFWLYAHSCRFLDILNILAHFRTFLHFLTLLHITAHFLHILAHFITHSCTFLNILHILAQLWLWCLLSQNPVVCKNVHNVQEWKT